MVGLRARIGAILLTLSLTLGLAAFAGVAPVSAAFVAGDEVVVFDGALNLRQEPGTSGLILQVLPDGTPLTVTGDPQIVDEIEWYPVVTAAAVNGYVSGQFIMLATEAPAGDFTVGDEIVVADGPLNLRNAAGTGATIVKTLATGTTGTILAGPTAANGMDWYQIQAGADSGWVAGDFLALSTGTPPTADFQVGDDIVVASGPLNLRDAAGTSATILKTLALGTTGTILAGPTAANGMDWYQIQAGVDTGWVAGDFLAHDTGSPPPTGDFEVGDDIVVADGPLNLRNAAGTGATIVKTLPTGATGTILAGPTAANGMDWYQIQTGADSGWVAGDFLALGSGTPTGDFAVGDDIVVASGPLNLRSAAGTGASIVKTLAVGTTGTVLAGPTAANGMDWYQIQAGADSGWVAGDFLAHDSGSTSGTFAAGSYVFVDVPKLNLRSIASEDGAVLQTMLDGTVGQVVSGPTTAGGFEWYQLSVNGQQGWAVGEYLVGGITVGQNAVVADGPVNLRATASSSGTALAAVPQGATVSITSGPTAGGSFVWFGASYNGQNGFIAGRFLAAP